MKSLFQFAFFVFGLLLGCYAGYQNIVVRALYFFPIDKYELYEPLMILSFFVVCLPSWFLGIKFVDYLFPTKNGGRNIDINIDNRS